MLMQASFAPVFRALMASITYANIEFGIGGRYADSFAGIQAGAVTRTGRTLC